MPKRGVILASMALGLIWGLVLLRLGAGLRLPLPPSMALALAGFPAGLILIVMVGRLAQRRFFDDASIDGAAFAPGGAAAIDQSVLTNTVEQIALALTIWPFAAYVLGPGVVLALALNFAVARLLFWAGYHLSPPLRGFGFAATFYPTGLAALWILWRLLGGAFPLPF
ncbi:MAPEG family protein [Pseudooceanicola sp.]|uniref:MAPEG family protein n=1 Tax=Pseudooceanicola sp. TaxID=1914328 RepID=UPI00262585FA|nr:MAPEG family protein [Pseudooceanicola sp.]MDF1853964.1 MAPEG family protein [Pseudooceanicola sp.]